MKLDIDAALRSPATVFREPRNVLAEAGLTRSQKVRVLRQWEQDARELAVAEEEGMGGGEESMLGRVLAALAELGAGASGRPAVPMKHGG